MKESDWSFKFEVPECSETQKLPLGSAMVKRTYSPPRHCTVCYSYKHFADECLDFTNAEKETLQYFSDSVPKICPLDHLEKLSECLKQLSIFHSSVEMSRKRQVSLRLFVTLSSSMEI